MNDCTFKTNSPYVRETVLKYMQIPYAGGGLSFEGCDCWGLVRLVYKEEQGVELTDYRDIYKNPSSVDGWWLIPDGVALQKYNVVLIAHKESIDHCGVMISDTDFLHILESGGVQISKISRWKSRIKGFYRYGKTVCSGRTPIEFS